LDQRQRDQERAGTSGAETALPPSFLGTAFEATPTGLVVIDSHATVVAANCALLRALGYQGADVIGRPITNLLPISLQDVQQSLRGANSSLPFSSATEARRELSARHADGRTLPVEVVLGPFVTPEARMVLASVIDAPDRASLERTFGCVFASATHGMALVNEDGRIVLLNEYLSSMLGYTRTQLDGQPVEILLPERFRGHHGELMQSFRRTPSTRRMGAGRELTARHASGADLPVDIGISELQWRGRRMTLVSVLDISARRRAELELKQANENLREFTRVASHDLRSPLRGIADLVQWVQEDLGEHPKAEVARNLARIGDRVSRLERLISDLLRYARSEQVDSDCVQIDFSALVQDILRVEPLPSGFAIDINVDDEPIWAPRTPLQTVLRNLINNAVKHHDRDAGQIVVDVRDDEGLCRISVSDDGPGFPEHAKDRVFRLFQNAGLTQRAGLGLGLALAKRLAEIHGGRMELVSPLADQRGSCFCLWWPRNPRMTNYV
jgi:PAS domain S-box-containing protein